MRPDGVATGTLLYRLVGHLLVRVSCNTYCEPQAHSRYAGFRKDCLGCLTGFLSTRIFAPSAGRRGTRRGRVAHALGVSEHIKERLLRIRGDLRIYKNLRPERTALVIIDMQNAFVAPGGAIEVPASRRIVPAINRVVEGCRE